MLQVTGISKWDDLSPPLLPDQLTLPPTIAATTF